jgi:hypothetical protein
VIIAQCASAPFIVDNESYYIQTIKWLNEYGFVKGLANLHIFFGQTSGWHIAQSAFSFSFLYGNFNDLSGFCLLLGNIFAVIKLQNYFKNHKTIDLIIGLFPLANVFFLQFVSAPSPDIPVYALTFIVFYYGVEKFKNIDVGDFNLISVLVFFIVFIKAMSIGLLLLPLFLLILNFKRLLPKLFPASMVGFIVLLVFVVKNSMLSGFPLFPTTIFRLDFLDHTVPERVAQYYFNENKLYSFFITRDEFESMTFGQIAMKWFMASKINGVLNCLTILIFLTMPLIIRRYFNQQRYWMLYVVALVQLLILLLTSPVYRFFIHLTFFFCCMAFAVWFGKKSYIAGAYIITTMTAITVLFIPVRFDRLTNNRLLINNSSFSYRTVFYPHGNSKSSRKMVVGNNGNPESILFFTTNTKSTINPTIIALPVSGCRIMGREKDFEQRFKGDNRGIKSNLNRFGVQGFAGADFFVRRIDRLAADIPRNDFFNSFER